MNRPRRTSSPSRARLTMLVVACAGTGLALLGQLPAGALAVSATSTPVVGNATYFDGLGAPYGGCGLPQQDLETQDFVALNVYNTPGDYAFYPRPLTGADAGKIGMWNNGLNCGRWVQVTLDDYCTGINDGAPGQAFCRDGAWTGDGYNGGVLTMLVADSCGDANAWCRDDPYHLDLSKASLSRFVKGGSTLTDLYPSHWNNRHVTWSFIPAPSYSGDLQIGFLQNAQVYWPAISVSHLANGIHGVEYNAGGTWHRATMNGDMGQSYIIGGTSSGGAQFQIRVLDASDTLINAGRVYSFSLPTSCGSSCGVAYTKVSYATSDPTPPTTPPPTTPPPTPVPGGCTAAAVISNTWPGGFQAAVTVTAGAAPVTGWSVTWTMPGGVSLSQVWNGTLTVSGSSVTVHNATWNGSLTPNASTSFGFTANGPAGVPVTTCTPG